MAYDKVVDSSVLDGAMLQIANAIREKNGTSANLAFPEEFVEAIAALETEQATPEITVSSSGLITATAGDKTAAKQLDTQAGTTVIPGTSAQTPVYAGRYTTGMVTVAGDSDLIPENIKKGVSIFSVTGTYEGSSGGGLPSGVSAMASDTFTPTETYGSAVKVKHNLGVTPNFVAWILEDAVTESAVANLTVFGVTINKTTKYSNQSEYEYNIHHLIGGYNATPILAGTTARSSSTTYFSETECNLFANSTYKFLPGYTYRWVACELDGIS